MKNSIKKNYFFNVSYNIFSIIVPFITMPYISRVLSVEGLGIYSYTYSIMRYFWIISALGTATLGTRTIAEYQEDRKKRSFEFWNILLLKIILSSINLILYFLYVIFIAKNKLISSIQSIYLFSVMIDISWLLQGMENFKKICIKNFIMKILNVIYIFIFVKSSSDLGKYIFGLAFFTLIGNLTLWTNVKEYVDKVKINELNPFNELSTSLQLFLPTVATQIFAILDKSMIGWFSPNKLENGYYEQAFKIVDMSLMLIVALTSVMIPRIASEYRKNNNKKIEEYINKSFAFVYMTAIPMIIGLNTISSIFVPWFFGDEYLKAVYILKILSFLYICMGITSVTGSQYLISTNQQRKHTLFLLVGGGCNFVLNLILIPKIYSIGAAIGSVIGELIIAIIELSYLCKNKVINIQRLIILSKNYIIAGLVMGLVLNLMKKIFLNNVVLMFSMIFVGIFIYLLILIIEKDSIVIEQFNKLIFKVKEMENIERRKK